MLKRTAFTVDLNGNDAERLMEKAQLAFDEVRAADREGGESNRGTIVCQLLMCVGNGGATIRGQFLPRKYAERVVAVFDDFSKDLREQEKQREPTTVEL